LRQIGNHFLRLFILAIPREQQQSARQAFFAGVEELVYQVRLDSNVSHQHVRDEAVGELVFLVERANHFAFLNDERSGRRNRRRSRNAKGLARKAPFTHEITWSQDRHNSLFAGFVDHGKSCAAFLDVDHTLRGLALRKDGFFASEIDYLSP
jgi:hypothetical protein